MLGFLPPASWVVFVSVLSPVQLLAFFNIKMLQWGPPCCIFRSKKIHSKNKTEQTHTKQKGKKRNLYWAVNELCFFHTKKHGRLFTGPIHMFKKCWTCTYIFHYIIIVTNRTIRLAEKLVMGSRISKKPHDRNHFHCWYCAKIVINNLRDISFSLSANKWCETKSFTCWLS